MSATDRLSPLARDARDHDRDRFVLTWLAPAAARESLFALYAFDRETARAGAIGSEPMLGRIRLQWWRETLDALYDGRSADHPVAQGLAAAIERHRLARWPFDHILDVRERELEEGPPATLAVLQERAEGTAAALLGLVLDILGVDAEEALRAARPIGIAWGLTGYLRGAAAGRAGLPLDLLAAEKVEGPLAAADPRAVAAVARTVATCACDHLRQARIRRPTVPREAVPALLTATLADGYLARLRATGYALFAEGWRETRPRPLRLAWRAWRGRY